MESQNQYIKADDEITLKELILIIKEYFNETLKYWWLIGIIGVLMGGLFLYRAYTSPKIFTASVTYTTSDGGGLGGMAGGLLGRFVGRGGGSPILKMQAMLSSRKIMEKVMFNKTTINGETDYLINHHIKLFELKDKEGELLSPYANEALSTLEERKIFQGIHRSVTKELLSTSLDEETGIASISINSEFEEYSYELASLLYSELEIFYVDSEVGSQKATLAKLEHSADSIYNLILSKTSRVASLTDKDKGRFLALDKLPEQRLQGELTFLTQVYAEVLRNLETVKFTVATSTPSIKAIDLPILPIKPKKKSIIVQTIIGGFLGGFLSVMFILARKIFRDIMSEDETVATT